ncbi:MAG: hypothetical protein WD738_15525 [Pirellulales bacterium]
MTSVQRRAAPLRRAITAGTTVLLYCSFVSPASAATPDATSERGIREEAVRAIPWRQMAPEHRRAAQAVIKNTSIYRRLPTRIIDCDPDMFTFLVQHPEVVIDVWRVMGMSQVALHRVGQAPPDTPGRQAKPDLPCYRGTDGAGTTGTVRFLYTDWGQNAQNLAVVFAEGGYEGKPFVTPLKAQSIILLRSGAVRETNGRHYVTVRIDSFLRIEQLGLELIAKTVQPWINKTADQNFIETLTFVSNFSRTAEQNPHGIERLATRLPTIDEPTRHELVALSFRTAERYAKREPTTGATLLAHRKEMSRTDVR